MRDCVLDGDNLNAEAMRSDSFQRVVLEAPPPQEVNALRRIPRKEFEGHIEMIRNDAIELRSATDGCFLTDDEASHFTDRQNNAIIDHHIQEAYCGRKHFHTMEKEDKPELIRHLRCIKNALREITPPPVLEYSQSSVMLVKGACVSHETELSKSGLRNLEMLPSFHSFFVEFHRIPGTSGDFRRLRRISESTFVSFSPHPQTSALYSDIRLCVG